MWYKRWTDEKGVTWYQLGEYLYRELLNPKMKGAKEFAQKIGFQGKQEYAIS